MNPLTLTNNQTGAMIWNWGMETIIHQESGLVLVQGTASRRFKQILQPMYFQSAK